jgi:hypothetical protein
MVMYILIVTLLDSRKNLEPKYGKHSQTKIYSLFIAECNFDLSLSFQIFELCPISKDLSPISCLNPLKANGYFT